MKLGLIFAASLAALVGGQMSPDRPVGSTGAPSVRVEEVAPSIILYREVRGDYSRHPEVFESMMKYVGSRYLAVGACFGIYPFDPDAVKKDELVWQVGVRVTTGAPLGFGNNMPIEQTRSQCVPQLQRVLRQLKAPDLPYHLKIMPAALAAVTQSTVANAPSDGLYIFKWMAENGYVQIAPTRMEFLSHKGSPTEIPTLIIVPVKKRESGLKLVN